MQNTLAGKKCQSMVGFTLIELMVAISIMALMAALSWRGIDGMVRVQTQIAQRATEVLTLQAGLSQWTADLDSIVQLPQSPALNWDGRGLRMTRRSTQVPGDGVLVVAWARRMGLESTGGQWLRWQSAPTYTKEELQTAWNRAAQWVQNPITADKRLEVSIAPLEQWQIFYFRGNAWTNPLSSGGTFTDGLNEAALLPDGVRLVLTLPANQAIGGTLVRDWARPSLGGSR